MSNQNRILNWKKGPEDSRDFKSVRRLTAPVELPSEFELDKQIPVTDQGGIGSCTAQSACSCFQYEVAQITNNFDFNPSRLFQYYNSRKLQGWENEDSGAYIRDAFKALNKWGLAKEALWPYEDTLQALVKEPSASVYEDGLKALAVKYAAVPQNEQTIKETLISGAAVSFGFNVYQSFFGSWESGNAIMPIPKKTESLQGGHACFTKDTTISLLDGREVSLEYLVENYSDKEFYVYSYDLDKNKIVAGKAHSPRKTGQNREILKITLDNGEEIKCTKNHPFLLKSGEYKNAEELEIGQSLMPLYRKLDDRGYEMILDAEKWVHTHRVMADWTQRKDHPKRTVVHHVDFNKRNNEPTNLQLMTWEDHTVLHATQGKLLTEYAQSEKGRRKSRETMLKNWADPIWREKRLIQNALNGKKTTSKLIEEGRCGFQAWDKEFHSEHGKKNIQFALEFAHTEEANKKRSETFKNKMETDPEFANQKQEIAIKNLQEYNQNADPEKKQLSHRKSQYTRYYKDKFKTFEEFISEKYPTNHKIANIEYFGVEDVYDITVEKYHNFALSSGVFVHNCTVIGFSDSKKCFLIQNSWGTGWGQNGKFWMPYSFAINPVEADDFWCIEEIKMEGSGPVPPKPSEIDWSVVSGILFKTAKELYAVKKPTIIRLGLALGLPVDSKKTFSFNYNLVKEKLGL